MENGEKLQAGTKYLVDCNSPLKKKSQTETTEQGNVFKQ
jgi:hypothetical protein